MIDDPAGERLDLSAGHPPEPFLDGISTRLGLLRKQYPDVYEVGVDELFVVFLIERSRFGRFEYGPVSIQVSVVEDLFVRTYTRTPPGEQWGSYSPSGRGFLQRVASEVARSGRRRVDELHWLLAFMRTPEGLPAKVFSELGVSAEHVEAFATSGVLPTALQRPPKLYSPEEVAEYLSVHVQTVRTWIRSGKLPAARLAGRRDLRVRETDLGAVLEPVEIADFRAHEQEGRG